MISPDRLLSQQQIYNFLRSVTIKYEPIAHYINDTLIRRGYGVNAQDPTTWKYYLNMVGKYHPSDTLMYVTSLDTRQKILFSPETLEKNPRTRGVYLPGGMYYNRLCALYPDQVDLIKSILFPVEDIEKAILSPDLTLLRYGSGYLEDYEEPIFIFKLEEFLDVIKERWYFNFLDDEPYFYLTFWGNLQFYLAMFLMSGRMSHIRTPYVHSWDLWNELEAHGLDNYSDILDREKSMMLYQNIEYFKTNAGKQSNLIILAERLLKSFGIGLYGRIVVQESETQAEKYQLTPQLVPVLLPANSEALPAPIEIKTVSTVQTEIYEKGLTQSTSAETVLAVERKLGDTTLNEFATKFLEIKPLAQNKPYAETLNMFLMETLIVSITQGYYTKPVEVLDPLTNDSIYLPPSELLALYHYAIRKSMGLESDEFPNTVRLYKSFTPTLKVAAKTIPYYDTKLYLTSHINPDEFLSGLDYNKNINSPSDFSENLTQLWLRYMSHLLMDQNTVIDQRHVILNYLSSLCHTRREISMSLVSGYDNYEEWLGSGGIDIYSTVFDQYAIQSNPKEQWSNLADKIINTLVPLNDILKKFGNFTLSDSGYERLRQLFVQMCSYRVVFLESERDTSEYPASPKWSTGYGPDAMTAYGDFNVITKVSTRDETLRSDNWMLHQGVTVHQNVSMVEESHVLLSSTTEMTEMKVEQPLDVVRFVPDVITTSASQGSLNFGYTPLSTSFSDD